MTSILAFTDPHGDPAAAAALARAIREHNPDAVVCAGDITFFGANYGDFLRRLGMAGREVHFVSGNHETVKHVRILEREFPFMRCVDFRHAQIAGMHVVGLPGSDEYGPASRCDEGAVQAAVGLWEHLDRSRPLVLLSHYPPNECALDGTSIFAGDVGGSATVRAIVERLRPAIVVCGHYHHDFGKTGTLGPTRLANPGPKGMLLSL